MKNIKKWFTVILALCMMIALLPCIALAADMEPVTYIERSWDGTKVVETEKTTTDYILITPETTTFEDGKTYVAKGEVEISQRIICGKDVKLILADDSVMKADCGIRVAGSSSLSIFGSDEDTGRIYSDGGKWDCAIGGNESETGGTITINGGEIIAESDFEAGISGTVTVNGAMIWTKSMNGAGIGSSYEGTCGNITINGGSICSKSAYGAAIGSGESGKCGSITINGGRISLMEIFEPKYGGSIGSGIAGSCGTVTINDGLIMCFAEHGYAFRGEAGFGETAGKMPDIRLGQNVVLYYGKNSEEAGSRNFYVTAKSKDIKNTLADQTCIVVYPSEQTVNNGTGSVFSEGSVVIIIGCSALLVGAAFGLLAGKKVYGTKKQKAEPLPADGDSEAPTE